MQTDNAFLSAFARPMRSSKKFSACTPVRLDREADEAASLLTGI